MFDTIAMYIYVPEDKVIKAMRLIEGMQKSDFENCTMFDWFTIFFVKSHQMW